MTHTLTHMPVAVPAVIGVAAILFAQDYYYLKEHKPTAEERQHGVLAILEKDIEWPTLAFFLFLFVLVGAAVATGLIESLAQGLAWLIAAISGGLDFSPKATLLLAALLILWVSGFLSAVIDNIPYTAVTIPLVASLLDRAQCRRRRPDPVVGIGARRLPGRQRHPDRRLGQRHGHRPCRKGRQAHLVQRVHRLRIAGRRR